MHLIFIKLIKTMYELVDNEMHGTLYADGMGRG